MSAPNLEKFAGVPPFVTMIRDPALMETMDRVSTLQVNLGRLCNLACKHCHLEAGPDREETMGRPVLDACLQLLRERSFAIVDITGGSPELHPGFRDFARAARPHCERLIVRSNLVLLLEPGYDDLPGFFRDNRLEVVCSLPHYTRQNTDQVRGERVFARSMEVLQKLNALGYGREKELVLNLVFNPGGAFLPPAQAALEKEYRDALGHDFGVVFDRLLTLTNNPLGRFGAFLERSGNLETYLNKLYRAFNPTTLEGMMCRDQVSVAWEGRLYDCDFNQAAKLPVFEDSTVFDWLGQPPKKRPIRFGQHCYACTAGQGSSCGGAIEG
jgi:radical SAM/Cys-rich protein